MSPHKPGFRSKVRTHTIQVLQPCKVSFTGSISNKYPSIYALTCSFFQGPIPWFHLPGSGVLIFTIVFNEYLYSASLCLWLPLLSPLSSTPTSALGFQSSSVPPTSHRVPRSLRAKLPLVQDCLSPRVALLLPCSVAQSSAIILLVVLSFISLHSIHWR